MRSQWREKRHNFHMLIQIMARQSNYQKKCQPCLSDKISTGTSLFLVCLFIKYAVWKAKRCTCHDGKILWHDPNTHSRISMYVFAALHAASVIFPRQNSVENIGTLIEPISMPLTLFVNWEKKRRPISFSYDLEQPAILRLGRTLNGLTYQHQQSGCHLRATRGVS